MNEKIEVACFQIITYMSTARTHFINAIQRAKEGKYDEATELIEEGEKAFELGHDAHADLLAMDMNGEIINESDETNKFSSSGGSMLLMHAEDQLMSAESFRILAEEFIELYMFGGTVEERMVPGAHAKYKASVYKKITNSNLFVESDVLQAEMINKETKKGVFCIDNQTYYNGNIIKNNINIKKKRIKYKIKRGLKKLVGDKLYNKIKTLIKGAKNEIK